MNFRNTLKINEKGHLEIGGADCCDLAKRFSTPLYVFDERQIRAMMQVYRTALEEEYGGNGRILYASKAFCCKAMYAIADEEGLGADVVSGGELFTALQAGFPAEKICMHGNNKLPSELREALDAGVGRIVLDSVQEIERLEALAAERGIVQPVLLRINPGVEAHTHAYIRTATPDSKFGFSVANGSAKETVGLILQKPHLDLRGFHCHIGSQIFEKQSFEIAAETCVAFAASLRDMFCLKELNLGGGFGIWYAEGDAKIPPEGYRGYLSALFAAVKAGCERYGVPRPYLYLEPGRSIVGEAGITLYTVGSVKEIPGIRKYLAVDGGMFENPRYCLYRSKYTAALANRMNDEPCELVSIAGKCCESGDLIGEDLSLPKANVGDLIAVFSTGAYNYSMASNYNRNLIPPAVLVKDGEAEYIVRPQTYEDLTRYDVLPARLK